MRHVLDTRLALPLIALGLVVALLATHRVTPRTAVATGGAWTDGVRAVDEAPALGGAEGLTRVASRERSSP